MKQTGTLYSVMNNESSVEIKEPIPNVFLYFSQNNVRKLTTKTDGTGKFDFDLPLGKYQVAVSAGATSQVYQLAGGSEFELATTSKPADFEQWVLAPAYVNPDENPLIVLLKSFADSANDSAVQAKSDADRAKTYADGMQDVESSLRSDINKKQDKLEFVGEGKVMKEGAYNFGIVKPVFNGEFTNRAPTSGFYAYNNPSNIPSGIIPYGSYIVTKYDAEACQKIIIPNYSTAPMHIIRNNLNGWESPITIYGTSNTTIDSNGFIKTASPIIKLFNDRIETNEQFIEEPVFEKLSTGTYKISNTLGLAKEGWYIEVPKDKNGLPYFMVDWLEDELTKEVTIFTYKRKFDFEKMDMINGDLVDIQEDHRWIDLRFHEEDNIKE